MSNLQINDPVETPLGIGVIVGGLYSDLREQWIYGVEVNGVRHIFDADKIQYHNAENGLKKE